jgi:hypothetical protein
MKKLKKSKKRKEKRNARLKTGKLFDIAKSSKWGLQVKTPAIFFIFIINKTIVEIYSSPIEMARFIKFHHFN